MPLEIKLSQECEQDAAAAALDALKWVEVVLNLSDPEHDDFCDSCADCMAELWTHADVIREAIAKLEAA